MAKFAALASVRATQLVVGETYTMGESKDAKTHVLVEFQGFFNGAGERVANPKVLKAMPQDWTMRVLAFTNGVAPEEVTIVKDPDGYGAVFLPPKTEGGKFRRVTFGADPALVASLKEAKEAAKEAARAAKEAEASHKEAAPVEETTVEEAAE